MQLNGIGPWRAPTDAALLAGSGLARQIERRAAGTGQVAYEVPPGESGPANLRSPNTSSALVTLVAFERGHLASHARKVLSNGGVVRRQSVDVKMAMARGGEMVPIAAAAETVYSDGEGPATESVRELAYAGELRRMLVAPGSAYMPFPRRFFPRVTANADTVLNALQIERDIRELERRLPPSLFETLRSLEPDLLRQRLEGLSRLAGPLGRLLDALAPLADREGFLASTVRVSARGPISARAVGAAGPGEHSINVVRLAQGMSVATGGIVAESPGVAGTFILNGEEVTVSATDTVHDIVRLINRGEDANRNGELDVDLGEDLNGNLRLDGGTERHGVHAAYIDGRLHLTAEPGTASGGRIDVEDPDGVLASLGLLDGTGAFARVIALARDAVVELDGVEHRSATNTLSGAIAGVELDLRATGTASLTVERDLDRAVELVRDLVEAYNAAVGELNRSLRPGEGGLFEEGVVARAREAVVGALNAPVAELEEATDEAADFGLDRNREGKASFFEEALSSVVRSLGSTLFRAPTVAAEGVPSVGGSLGELGIVSDGSDGLRLDEAALRGALSEGPQAAAELFSRAGDRDDMADWGIAARAARYLEALLDETGGGLAIRRDVLNELIANQSVKTYAERISEHLRPAAISYLI